MTALGCPKLIRQFLLQVTWCIPHHVKQKAARKSGGCAWSMDDMQATSKRHSDPNKFVLKIGNSQFQGFYHHFPTQIIFDLGVLLIFFNTPHD